MWGGYRNKLTGYTRGAFSLCLSFCISCLDPAVIDLTWILHLFQGHDNDIRCMAQHPNRTIVATGQMANALDGPESDFPYVCIWDTQDVGGTICKLSFPSEGESYR